MRLSLPVALACLVFAGAAAAEPVTHNITLTLRDHRFTPDRVEVPSGQRIRIELINQDGATEEFDSVDLNVEKDVTPKGRISFVIGPLAPGAYSFMGELHAETASGTLVAVAAR